MRNYKMSEFTYEIPSNIDGTPSTETILRSDGAWIPVDEGNKDYQQYLIDTDGGLSESEWR